MKISAIIPTYNRADFIAEAIESVQNQTYSIDEIIPFLEERGIKKYQIGKIFFIQELALYLDEVVDLGDKTALTSIDSIVTVIPKKLMDSEYKYKIYTKNKSIYFF